MTTGFARGAVATIAAATLVTLAGCSSKANVSGKVTYGGKALTSGAVSLIARDNIQYSGTIGAGGSFSIPNVPTGAVKILVSSPNPGSRGQIPSAGEGDFGGGGDSPAGWFPIPDKYADLTKTDLTGEVGGNPAVLNIDLK